MAVISSRAQRDLAMSESVSAKAALKGFGGLLVAVFLAVFTVAIIYFVLSALYESPQDNQVLEEDNKTVNTYFTITALSSVILVVFGFGLLYYSRPSIVNTTEQSTDHSVNAINILQGLHEGDPRLIVCRHDLPGVMERCETVPFTTDEERSDPIWAARQYCSDNKVSFLQGCRATENVLIINVVKPAEGKPKDLPQFAMNCPPNAIKAKLKRLQAYQQLIDHDAIRECVEQQPGHGDYRQYTVKGDVGKTLYCPATSNIDTLRFSLQKHVISQQSSHDYKIGYVRLEGDIDDTAGDPVRVFWEPANLLHSCLDGKTADLPKILATFESFVW